MRGKLLLLLSFLVLVPVTPDRSAAQDEKPVIGAAAGVAGGALITLGIIVGRARWQQVYLDSADDLIHWQSTPMIAAPAVGILFGLAGDDALKGSLVGSTSGMVVGAGVGAGLGWLLSAEQEWPWAGGVIGAALGMSIGGIWGGLTGWRKDHDPDIPFPDALRFGLSVPVR
jgi:hypothetical protein